MLLGDEGLQAVPGHPHVWEEPDGRFFLGYDFRAAHTARRRVTGLDRFGLRELHWVDGWPTIWRKVVATFDSAARPDAVGGPLVVALEAAGGVAGFDRVRVAAEARPSPSLSPAPHPSPTARPPTVDDGARASPVAARAMLALSLILVGTF